MCNRLEPPGLQVFSREFVRMSSPEVAEKLRRFHMRHCFEDYQCLLRYDDQGPRGENPPIIPYAPVRRSRVYTGTRETGSYNHHSQLAKFKGRYYLAWSNGIVDEEAAGQRILIATSDDGVHWSEPVCVAGGRDDPVVAHNCIALRATKDRLYVVGMKEDTTRDATVPGMRRIDPESHEVNVYASEDGVCWEKVFTFTDRLKWVFEAPRATADGHLMCVAALKDGAAILRWPGLDLCAHPEVISVPQPYGARFPYGEGTWYQTDDGRIIVFWRDEGQSCRTWVNLSRDGGRTFTPPAMSDIPDSMSRLSAGRLVDGRYYLCNNAFPTLLNRLHLFLLLSDDGYVFNKVYLIADDPTAQRLAGLLKVNGYQYPCCLPDADRLLIAHSVNKEDIECGIINTTAV
ncbi:MAG: hypothetical protein GXP31_03450 [Kiritimatiellaeota bacterium]|nr:hypothetical protein [Kiritimatiellota bacterium]